MLIFYILAIVSALYIIGFIVWTTAKLKKIPNSSSNSKIETEREFILIDPC